MTARRAPTDACSRSTPSEASAGTYWPPGRAAGPTREPRRGDPSKRAAGERTKLGGSEATPKQDQLSARALPSLPNLPVSKPSILVGRIRTFRVATLRPSRCERNRPGYRMCRGVAWSYQCGSPSLSGRGIRWASMVLCAITCSTVERATMTHYLLCCRAPVQGRKGLCGL